MYEGAAAMGPAPHEQRSRRSTRRRLGRMTMAVSAGAAALALVAAGCSSSNSSSGGSGSGTTGARQQGGTAVWAEPPSTTPNYIFPFTSSAYISVINASNFTNLMYRPLYWFGDGAQPLLNNSLSLANPPVRNGNTATITLKKYKWSNGQTVTATDVMFWLNMLADTK